MKTVTMNSWQEKHSDTTSFRISLINGTDTEPDTRQATSLATLHKTDMALKTIRHREVSSPHTMRRPVCRRYL